MKSRFATNLHTELRSVGADNAEAAGLVTVAARLGKLKTAASRPAVKPHLRRKAVMPLGLAGITGLIIGALLVMLSQASLPGNWLYPVKKVSEHVAVAIDPDYRGTVMMQRAQEVQKLVADHASAQEVLATLADYQAEAVAYKSNATNYSIYEFCKASLQQAESRASGPERQAISNTLSSLDDV